jgi:hypothetical protein
MFVKIYSRSVLCKEGARQKVVCLSNYLSTVLPEALELPNNESYLMQVQLKHIWQAILPTYMYMYRYLRYCIPTCSKSLLPFIEGVCLWVSQLASSL